MIKRLACAMALAAALTAASQAHAAAADAFDAEVAAAKSAMMTDPGVALARSQRALTVARQRQADHEGVERVATAQWLKGEALIRLNRLDEARPVIEAGLAAVAKAAPNSKLHGDLMSARAEVMATEGAVQPALEGFQAAYRIFGAAGQPRSQAMALQNIGSIYQDAGDYQKVLRYYAQSAELYRDDPILLMSAHNNVGNALKELKRFPEAVAEFRTALVFARQMKSPLLEASILENLASTEVQAGDLGAAQKDLDEGLAIARSDAAAGERPYLWGVAAQIAQKRGQTAQAAQLIERTFQGADLSATDLTFRDFHRTAYETYAGLGDDHRALAHLKAYKRLDDAARTLAASTNAALAAAQFDFANQQSRIAKLKAGQLQRDVKLAKQRNLITVVLLMGAVTIGLLFAVAFLSIRRSRNAVRTANVELQAANQSLEKALNARAQFLATTSHEIRTPLNGILGMTQVLLGLRKLDADVRDKIALVHTQGENMKALVDDILDIARIEQGDVQLTRAEFDLVALLNETGRLWRDRAQAKGLTLAFDAAAAPPRIIGDAGRLRQVLFNLLSNALKFTERGQVGLSVRAEADGDGEVLVLEVSDSGIGIAAEHLAGIFDTFHQVDGSVTRTYGGTGLGLAICRRLAQGMGGDIAVASTPGEGSTFTVRVPLERGAAPLPAAAAPQGLADCRVLLADANPLAQAVIRAVLQPQTRAIEVVGSAEEACEAAAGGRFDLVLVEAAALGGETAERLAAMRRLAEAAGAAVIVVLIGDAREDELAGLSAAGAAQIVRKPISGPALLAELRAGQAARRGGGLAAAESPDASAA